MAKTLFGIETEYGLSVIAEPDSGEYSESAACRLLELARKMPHLQGRRSSGMFLANGARLYADVGEHPEYCTPECTNPWDVCRYTQAGDQTLLELATRLKQRDRRVKSASIFKNNVDYTTRATFGCHESYLHREADQAEMAQQLIPHLTSRLVYSGAGGWDCYSPGIEFVISPRVPHLRASISSDSTNHRGIYHTREEALAGNGYRRLHILCGESLRGETGTFLKVGATALVVALIEAGMKPAGKIAFDDPLAAMRVFASDISCSKTVKLSDGSEASAIDIQRRYLEQAEAHIDDQFMPPWAGEVCSHWRAILDRLQNGGAAAVARTLDWSIKLALFQNHIRRRDTTFEAIANWTQVLAMLSAALEKTERAGEPLTAALILSRSSPIVTAKKFITPTLRRHGLDWSGIESFLALRLELFEIDLRYSLLGEGGLFDALDRNGVLDHRFPGVDNIPHAIEYPPEGGRAALRGGCIRNLFGKPGEFACEWDAVWDMGSRKILNLADPFRETAEWNTLAEEAGAEKVDMDTLFRRGRYAELLANLAAPIPNLGDLETVMLSHARVGRRERALEMLESARAGLGEFHFIALSMSVFSNGLVPASEETEILVARGAHFLDEDPDDYSRYIFWLYKGALCLHKKLYPEAEDILVSLVSDGRNQMRPRMFARTQCYLAELYRRLGRKEEALTLAETALRTHSDRQFIGDLADHSLPLMAKLATESAEASQYLDEAENTQRTFCNKLGLARILCLRGRRLNTDRDKQEFELLQRTIPILSDCQVAQKIVHKWNEWTKAAHGTVPVDYWGV